MGSCHGSLDEREKISDKQNDPRFAPQQGQSKKKFNVIVLMDIEGYC
jgi:hypothetical protein